MNVADMPWTARLWWLLVMPILAGLGIERILEWLPEPWRWWAMAAGALGVLVWCARELRWSRRMMRELEADSDRLAELTGDERYRITTWRFGKREGK